MTFFHPKKSWEVWFVLIDYTLVFVRQFLTATSWIFLYWAISLLGVEGEKRLLRLRRGLIEQWETQLGTLASVIQL